MVLTENTAYNTEELAVGGLRLWICFATNVGESQSYTLHPKQRMFYTHGERIPYSNGERLLSFYYSLKADVPTSKVSAAVF